MKPYLQQWWFGVQTSPGCCGLPSQSHPSSSPDPPAAGPSGCSDRRWRGLCDRGWGSCVPGRGPGLWWLRSGPPGRSASPAPGWGSSATGPEWGCCVLGQSREEISVSASCCEWLNPTISQHRLHPSVSWTAPTEAEPQHALYTGLFRTNGLSSLCFCEICRRPNSHL